MKILKYDIIRYERTDVMNYKINMKCELKNVSETLKDKQEELKKYLLEKLKELDFITIYNANSKGPVVAFNIKGVFSQDASIYLDKYNICIRAGNHCTKMLKDEINIKNTCRISLALYNNKEEIDLLINVLKNSKNIWKEIL